MDVLTRSVITQFEQYVKLNKKVPPEILTSLAGIEQAGRLADTVAAHMSLKLSEKQKVLEIPDVRKRLEHMLAVIEGEMDVLQIEKRIRGRVKQQMEKSQREYYLNEQMKAIQKELGELDDAPNEIGELEKRIKAAGMPKEAREKANSELAKLKLMSPMSAEATVVRNYVDWLVKSPWKKRSKVHLDIADAEKVLEAGPLRPREGQRAHRRVSGGAAAGQEPARPDPVPGRPPGRRQDLARARAWRVPPTASSCACRWAACATRRRSAAIAAPTSARCPARSSRTSPSPGCAIRCSCSMRSTRCRRISAAIRPRRCSKCSTRSRTAPSTIITSRSISISPR